MCFFFLFSHFRLPEGKPVGSHDERYLDGGLPKVDGSRLFFGSFLPQAGNFIISFLRKIFGAHVFVHVADFLTGPDALRKVSADSRWFQLARNFEKNNHETSI